MIQCAVSCLHVVLVALWPQGCAWESSYWSYTSCWRCYTLRRREGRTWWLLLKFYSAVQRPDASSPGLAILLTSLPSSVEVRRWWSRVQSMRRSLRSSICEVVVTENGVLERCAHFVNFSNCSRATLLSGRWLAPAATWPFVPSVLLVLLIFKK